MSNTPDNISSYDSSLDKLVSGINKVCEVIKPTYGPSGSNVVIEENLRPGHRIANDGKLITDAIWFSDPVEMIGKNILAEACEKQEREAGDGRKTTIILTTAILNEGLKYKDKINPIELKKQLDSCLPIIIKSIDEQKKEISTEEVGKIAKVASESEEIGSIIEDIYPLIGRDGIIELDTSGLPASYYDIIDGVRVRAGWFGGYWQTEEGKCVVKNPKILISKDRISSVANLESLYKDLAKENINELVIYCEDIDVAVASRLALTSVQGGFKTLIIKAPIMWKDWLYEDLAKATGAKPVDSKMGNTFKLLKSADLGSCDKLVCTKDETRIIGIKDIRDYVEKLKAAGLKDDQQLVRASWLNTKVAVLKVGANSESELSWKLKKTKDAINASYYALKDGIVPGMGKSFLTVSLPDTIGGKILSESLDVPFDILKDNGLDDDVVDPAIVVKSAITTAISIAGIILTTKGALIIPQEIKDEIKAMQQRMTPR